MRDYEAEYGMNVVGGCGTTPAHIAEIAKHCGKAPKVVKLNVAT